MTLSPLQVLTVTLFAFAVRMPFQAEMRVAQPAAMRAAVHRVPPGYNPIARQLKVQGEVQVEAHVSPTGDVTEVKVLSGSTLLTANVIKAVRDWCFQPFQENGRAIEAVAMLSFTFKL